MNSYAVYSSETLDSGQDLSEAGGGWTGLMPEQGGSTVEISLDPELLNTLYRRSRRRLRDIQASCQALLKLDRTRSSLRVTGSEEAIRAVRRHLENLCGPCKPLPAAVWAELMRTRTLSHSSRATIARLQNQSGCRIHIERSRQEVRLFGPKEGIAVADKLLDEFAGTCGEEAVSAGSPTSSLCSTTLQALAHAFSVTLRVEDHQVVVLGIKESVAEACKELRTFISNPDSYDAALLPKAPDSECEELAAKEPKELTRAAGAGTPGNGVAAGAARMGVVTKTKLPSEQFTSKGSAQAHQAEHSAAKSSQGGGRQCPTCGSGRFCSGCGAAIWQVNVLPFMPQGMMAAGIPMQPGYEVQAQCMAGAMGGMALQQPDQREGFEPDGQMQQQQAWGPVQQPQMMYCMDPKAAGKMSAATGMVPVQFPAMQQGSSGNASASRNTQQQHHHQQQQQQQQQQPGQQMGMMQAYMVPASIVPAWCGL